MISVLYCTYGNLRYDTLVKIAQKLTLPPWASRWRSPDRRAEGKSVRCRDSQWLPQFHYGISLPTLDFVSEAEEAKRGAIICTTLCEQRVLEDPTRMSEN